MDSGSNIVTCRRLLEELREAEKIDNVGVLNKLAGVFEHLPPQVAPRHQQDYDHCSTHSDDILSNLFEKVDLSDKSLLNSLLKLLLAYGNFRIAQITYHIESHRDEIEPDLRHTPIVPIGKSKFYDLTPLLPPAGTVGWKGLLIYSGVKDPYEDDLRRTSRNLLVQKLHFYAIISQLDRFRTQTEAIRKNGLRVAEKLAEEIFDSANDDQEVVDVDAFQFNLITHFTEEVQVAALIEAFVKARLKCNPPPELVYKQQECALKLTNLVNECLMNKPNLQEAFVIKLIEHLKCNLMRRKRRHSVEAEEEDVTFTLEGIISDILAEADPKELVAKSCDIKLHSKNLQTAYLEQWINFLIDVSTRKTLTPRSSVMIVMTLSVLLVTTANTINHDLRTELSILMAKIIDATNPRRVDRFFKLCGPGFLSELTQQLAQSTSLLETFENPVIRFYRSYFARYMMYSTIKNYHTDVEKFSVFIETICDKSISKSKSHVLEYVYLSELTDFLTLGQKVCSKSVKLYVDYGKTVSKRLYKFIKHRPFSKVDSDQEITGSPKGECNGHADPPISGQVQAVVIDALVCIIKIAVDQKEQQMLDTYGELMLKLYNLMCLRFDELMQSVRLGRQSERKAIDPHLHRLLNLYSANKIVIEPYLCYDLNAKICEILILSKTDLMDVSDNGGDESKEKKVAIYEDLKLKLESIAEKDTLIYQSIINSQYSSVLDQTVSQVSRVGREDICYKHYLDDMLTVSEVLATLFQNCDSKMYDAVLSDVLKQFETCDALNHPQILGLFYVLESLIPKRSDKDAAKDDLFKKAFPTIGCCLIRIAKSVELGPSIISFTNAGTHKSSGGIQCCIYSHCIRIYALIFDRYPAAFTNTLITDAMQICISSNLVRYAKYSDKLHRFFVQLASSIARLLKAISMGKKAVVDQSMPVFLSVFSTLIRCIILASDRKKLEDIPQTNGHGGDTNGLVKSSEKDAIEISCKIYESQLEHLAHDVGRLANNLCHLETKLVDYAPHLVSTYIKDTQRASCPEFVKKHLDEGIYRIFNLVDSYQKDRQEKVIESGAQRKTTAGKASGSLFEMIHARLDQASREIFKDMHDEYNRFHRYQGKC